MCPAIVTDSNGDVKLVVGAAGGTRITTGTALVWDCPVTGSLSLMRLSFQTSLRNLWLGQDIKSAIDGPRVHHQLYPMTLVHEEGLDRGVAASLASRGHEMSSVSRMAVVGGVARGEDGRIYANADYRKAGGVDGF